MNILKVILIVVEIVSCLMLVGVILLQQSKGGGGMGTAFGGGMGETMFGARAGNILTKITITLAVIFLANTTFLGMMYTTKQESSIVDEAGVPEAVPMAQQPSPAAGSPQVPAPSRQGTLFTPEDAPAPESAVVPVEVEPVTFEDVPAEPVTP